MKPVGSSKERIRDVEPRSTPVAGSVTSVAKKDWACELSALKHENMAATTVDNCRTCNDFTLSQKQP